jgi:hypothetical protein
MTTMLPSLHITFRHALGAFAVTVVLAGCATPATAPRIDESELQALGFKVLVATTPVQQEWVQRLTPGQIRPLQRNGKDYYIYPDAPRNQVYVGGPEQYKAYRELHPDNRPDAQQTADSAAAYRTKQADVMRTSAARDNSNPWLGASWYDLGW